MPASSLFPLPHPLRPPPQLHFSPEKRAAARKPTPFRPSRRRVIFLDMKDRPPPSDRSVYVPPHQRLRSVITVPKCSSPGAVVPSLDNKPRSTGDQAAADAMHSPLRQDHQRKQQLHERDYDCSSDEGFDLEPDWSLPPGAFSMDTVDEWKRKLTMLLRSKDRQELISRGKKRDFEHIVAVASKMGLYSQVYSKALVVSKVPLPNYRFDLDDKRPQRQVSLPLGLLRKVEGHLGDYLSHKPRLSENCGNSFSRSSSSCSMATEEGFYEQPEPLASSRSMMEKVLGRRSLQLHEQQQAWQVHFTVRLQLFLLILVLMKV